MRNRAVTVAGVCRHQAGDVERGLQPSIRQGLSAPVVLAGALQCSRLFDAMLSHSARSVLMLHGQRLSLSRSRCHSNRDNQARPLAFTCHGIMGIIADTFGQLLDDLKQQDEQSRLQTQETINRANKLLAELEELEEDEMN